MDVDGYIAHLANYYFVFFVRHVANIAFLAVWAFPFGSIISIQSFFDERCIEFGSMASVMVSRFTLGALKHFQLFGNICDLHALNTLILIYDFAAR